MDRPRQRTNPFLINCFALPASLGHNDDTSRRLSRAALRSYTKRAMMTTLIISNRSVLLIVLMLVGLLALTGCEKETPPPPAPAATVTVTPTDAKPYPLDVCIVSDHKLGGEMGEPVVLVHEGQEIKFCCQDCVPDFKKDPAKYLAKLKEAAAPATDAMPEAPTPNDHEDHAQ